MRMNSLIAAALIGTGMAVRFEHVDDGPWIAPSPKRKAKPKPVVTEPEKVWPETRQQRRYRERKETTNGR